ncbi:ABC transporter substrate-binding protein [Bradyrhizobium monzae]|uniref:ABC transporter substrate-binding protein n=1 Tax=Bradyrhizobium sp. Oc8 TaxID=2876780 RepID=UPI001F42A2EC|nr:ABC transporter substrate-binding protein [Bradyrhizobium sp. Oc8]
MRRREFIVGLSAVASIGRAAAQDRVHRLGMLVASPRTAKDVEAALESRGWRLGRNLLIEARVSGGDTDRTRQYARELLAMKPDVLFAETNTSMAALQAQSSTIPTVFVMVSDPVGMHYVESFAKPGRNVTGFAPFEPSLGGKWVALLKEAAPDIEHIGLVYNPEPGNNSAAFRKSIDEISKTSGIASLDAPVGASSDIERLILSFKDRRKSGLIFLPDALTSLQRDSFVALVARCGLPAIYPLRLFCTAGGLMSYGVDLNTMHEGAASYVDRILRGANPGSLPVQGPTEFKLVVNQKAARQLGLQLPATLLARADEVIE